MKLTIPDGVDRVVLKIRHSIASKTGNDFNKMLTLEGVRLCHEVADFYRSLVSDIAEAVNVQPRCFCSPFPRSMATAWEIFHASNIQQEQSLRVHASLTAIDGGKWFAAKKAEKKTEPQMIREFLADLSPRTPDFAKYKDEYIRFVDGRACGTGESNKAKFVVAVCHEAGISLAAENYLPADQLGLANCEAVLFYVAGGAIVGAEKIVPEKKELPMTLQEVGEITWMM